MGVTIVYGHPPGVAPQIADRPLLSTSEGGFVAVDTALIALWRAAAGRSFDDLVAAPPEHSELAGITGVALACLAEAGLLSRTPAVSRPDPPLGQLSSSVRVSAVIVISGPGELVWLDDCIRALSIQQHPLHTILIVDNVVGVDVVGWLAERGLPARVHSLTSKASFASALNAGREVAGGVDYLLMMNADIRAHPSCVRNLVARAAETPRCAAVAPKLYLWRTPAFLNGMGNRVPGWGYGTDNGIGQLDLGQLDRWTEVPSGCLAALLVAVRALDDIGGFDAGYPLYYEDTDWSYRARLLGYRIAAAPDAHVLHAFAATSTGAEPAGLSAAKLEKAVTGQIRFAVKVGSPGRTALLVLHALKDAGMNFGGAIHRRNWKIAMAYIRAAGRTSWNLPALLATRWRVQSRRAIDDAELFAGADDLTPSMVWRNAPELTSANVRNYYAPLIANGMTRRLPESDALMGDAVTIAGTSG